MTAADFNFPNPGQRFSGREIRVEVTMSIGKGGGGGVNLSFNYLGFLERRFSLSFFRRPLQVIRGHVITIEIMRLAGTLRARITGGRGVVVVAGKMGGGGGSYLVELTTHLFLI